MESINLLTTAIVEESLRKDLGCSARLVSWTDKNGSATGDNFFNEVKQLNVRYILDGKELEVSYIAKLNPCKSNDLFNPYRERAMKKEVFFYEQLLPILNLEIEKMGGSPLNVPKYIHSSLNAEKEVIILENLKQKGYVTFPKGREMDEEHSRIMAREISKLHAASIALQTTLGDRNMEEIYPLLVESWLVGDFKLSEAFNEIFKKGLNHNLKLTKTLNEFEELLPWLKSLKNKEMETLVRELNSTNQNRVICHGDYHRTNVLFRYNEWNIPEDVMIIDWQTVRIANVGSEISYLLFSSFFGPLRLQHLPLITTSYYESLKQLLGQRSRTLECLRKEIETNQFGFLICFYLIPLSLCVSHPSKLFTIEENSTVNTDEKEELKSASELLQVTHRLAFVLKDYLNHASRNIVRN